MLSFNEQVWVICGRFRRSVCRVQTARENNTPPEQLPDAPVYYNIMNCSHNYLQRDEDNSATEGKHVVLLLPNGWWRHFQTSPLVFLPSQGYFVGREPGCDLMNVASFYMHFILKYIFSVAHVWKSLENLWHVALISSSQQHRTCQF